MVALNAEVSIVDENQNPLNSKTLTPKKPAAHLVSSLPAGHFQNDNSRVFSASMRSRRSCCSEHDPPPHWFTAEVSDFWLHLLGILLALLAGLFLTVGGLLIARVKTLQALEISGFRSLAACLYLIPLIIYFKPKHDFDKTMLFETFGVSIVFCAKFVTFSVGSKLLPLSEFSLICNTVPVFTAVLGCLFLSERCGVREWLSCIVVMLGVGTTFVPKIAEGFDMKNPLSGLENSDLYMGYVITALSSMSNALALCWLRRLKEVHSLLVSFYACLITGIVSMAASLLLGQYKPPTDTEDLLLIGGAAVCMLTQALLPAIACSLTQASKVAVAMTFSVIFAFVLQYFVDGTAPSIYALAGGFLIILAMVIGNSSCGNESNDELTKEERMTPSRRYGSTVMVASGSSQ